MECTASWTWRQTEGWLGQQPEVRWVRLGVGRLRWGSLLLLSGEVVWQGLELLAAFPWEVPGHWHRGGIGSLGMMASRVVGGQGERKRPVKLSLPRVELERSEDGYQIRLEGEFYLRMKAEDTFWLRMVILFLRQLEGPVQRRTMRQVAQEILHYLASLAHEILSLGIVGAAGSI